MYYVSYVISLCLFLGDEIRRIILESLFPFVKEVFLATKMQRKGNKQKCLPPHDLTLTEYDLFDDYLEMVIQFGVNKFIN